MMIIMRHLKILKNKSMRLMVSRRSDDRSIPGGGTDLNFKITVMSILNNVMEKVNHVEKEMRISME